MSPARLFFRNDDLGWDLAKFDRLLSIFARTDHKLNAAAIPLACLEVYDRADFNGSEKHLQVHAHGLAHLDHEEFGKKCEFGPARDLESVRRDLRQSFEITERVFTDMFYPAFTPPWNRMLPEFIALLPTAGFQMLSRDGKKSAGVDGLAELNIDIDLHTAKTDRTWSVDELLLEIQTKAKAQAQVGIMLHHKHMADRDYEFLEQFLERLNREGVSSHFFSEMAGS